MPIFSFNYSIFLWSVITRTLMNNSFFLKNFPNILLKYSFQLSLLNTWIFSWNCVCTILNFFLKTCSTSDFSLNKCTHVILVWSSMNVMNHFFLEKVVIVEGPQTSLRMIEKGLDCLYDCRGKGERCCFSNSQISHWNEDGFLFRNRFRKQVL